MDFDATQAIDLSDLDDETDDEPDDNNKEKRRVGIICCFTCLPDV